MVTFAQAQERAELWINGDVPAYQQREVRVREFDLGFVVWSEDRPDGPVPDTATDGARMVIARDSGDTTLWPGLPVGEVIRRYEECYGATAGAEPSETTGGRQQRIDLNATSFLLTPPEWLQEAADAMSLPDQRLDIPDQRSVAGPAAGSGSGSGEPQGAPSAAPPSGSAAASAPSGGTPWADTNSGGDDGDRSVAPPATVFAPPLAGSDDEDTPVPGVRPDAKTELLSGGSALPRTAIAPQIDLPGGPGAGPPAGPAAGAAPGAADIANEATRKASPGGPTPPPPPGAPGAPGARPGAGGQTPPPPAPPPAPSGPGAPGAPAGGYVPTQLVAQLDPDAGPGGQTPPPGGPGGGDAHAAATMLAGGPGQPGAPGAPGQAPPPGAPQPPQPPGAVHAAATMLAGGPGQPGAPGAPGAPGQTPPPGPGGPGFPPPPGPPGVPGQAAPSGPHPPGPPGVPGAGGSATPPPPFPGAPGAPGPPGAPGAPGNGVHAAATMLAGGPGQPGAPGAPGAPGMAPPTGPPVPGATPPPGAAAPGMAPPGYAYPQPPPGQPTVGPGYMAVLRYRAQDGSEQQLIRRSAPGTPHPEWQILHELRSMNVPPQQVLELHTELESCDLPGGYCARMIHETWPQVRISHTAPYGRDHATRQQGVRHLLEHQGELHQVADGPARPAPNRVPLPHPSQVQPVPPVPPEGLAHELGQAFGPGIFRFDQRAVSRMGVPDVVAQTLVWAGLPVDFGPFFWAQAQPGRPVPTLAELAAERGVQPAADAGSYLVMGNDFGRQLCVQYGTAHIVAIPLEAVAQPVPPQFVNTGLPEFVRCIALLGRMWRLRYGLTPEQAGRWTVDFQAQLAALDPAALSAPDNWWAVLLEQMWDGLL
ncbi:SUKH-4 family immunity protein [Streptomyces sp. NPDC048636]|uniref:SUKH-4 family immunity protein n=1 Tax=Streptomyces sp. NPDC048636 TaxID=3155762 RepID=UPI00343A2237